MSCHIGELPDACTAAIAKGRIQRVSASHEMILCDERRLECAVRY